MPKAAHPTHLKDGKWRIRWLDEHGVRQSDVFPSRAGGRGGLWGGVPAHPAVHHPVSWPVLAGAWRRFPDVPRSSAASAGDGAPRGRSGD